MHLWAHFQDLASRSAQELILFLPNISPDKDQIIDLSDEAGNGVITCAMGDRAEKDESIPRLHVYIAISSERVYGLRTYQGMTLRRVGRASRAPTYATQE